MNTTLQKPRALRPGMTVGLIGPSSPTPSTQQLDACITALEALDYRVVQGESIYAAYGYLAGTDPARAADLNAMFANPEIDAVWCMRGGYGAMRILDLLDFKIAEANPKPLIGFSDVTALHIAYARYSRLVTFHGPMPISALGKGPMDPFSKQALEKALRTTGPLGDVPSAHPLTALAPGKAEGPLVGGNLSLIAGTLGTPYELDTKGALLFLEEVGEKTYAVDRMLTQLRLAGKLKDCAGLVLGDFTDCADGKSGLTLPLEQVFADLLLPLGKPVLAGLSIGHGAPNGTLPLGIKARLDADAHRLTYLESAVL